MSQFHLHRPVRNLESVLEVFHLARRHRQTLETWRCAIPADWPPADASRSARYAGRWHHPADSEALYSAGTSAVASEEATDRLLPGTYLATLARLELRGSQVVFLREVVHKLPWTLDHLLADGLGYARAIVVGTMACRTGVDILVVPSARQPTIDVAVCFMVHQPSIRVTERVPTRLVIPPPDSPRTP